MDNGGNGIDVSRLFRREWIVSDADLRIDVVRGVP